MSDNIDLDLVGEDQGEESEATLRRQVRNNTQFYKWKKTRDDQSLKVWTKKQFLITILERWQQVWQLSMVKITLLTDESPFYSDLVIRQLYPVVNYK